jgi:iron complex outermembrane receptor protein
VGLAPVASSFFVCISCLAIADEPISEQKIVRIEQLNLEELLNVPVETVSRRKEAINEAPGVITVWTREELLTNPARTLQDVIKLLPGFDTFDSPDEGRHLAGVRGIPSGSILVLLDGQRLNTSLDPLVDLDLPLENIERIEAIRGPGSTIYGTYAFTGVINVITRKPEQVNGLEVRGRVGERFSTAGKTSEGRLSVSVGRRSGDWSLGAFGQLLFDQGKRATIEADAETLRRARLLQDHASMYTQMPLTAPEIVTPESSREQQERAEIDLNAAWRDDVVYHGKLLLSSKQPIVGRTFAVNEDSTLNRVRTLQSLAWSHTFSLSAPRFPSLSVELKYSLDYQRDSDTFQDQAPGWNVGLRFYQPGWEVFPEGVIQKISLDYLSNMIELKLDGALRFLAHNGDAPDFHLTLGFSFEDARVLAARSLANYGRVLTGPNEFPFERYQYVGAPRDSELFRNDPNKKLFLGDPLFLPSRYIVAGYVQARWDITRWLSAVVGVRLDDYSDFGLAANPRAALLFTPREDLFVKVLYGRAFNAPSFFQLYSATPEQTTMAGKPDLRPEIIDTVELQLGYQHGPLRTTLTGYYFLIGNLIRRISVLKDFTGEEYRYDNVSGLSKGYGGEFEAKLRLREGLRAFANLSWQRVNLEVGSSNTSSSIPLDVQPVVLPEVKATAGITYTFFEKLSVDLSFIVASERTQADKFPAGSAVREYRPAPAYFIANAALTADRLWDRLFVKLIFMDIFGSGYRDYVLNLPYHLERGTTELYLELGVKAF